MSTEVGQRRSGITLLTVGIIIFIGAAVVFFTMAEPFPMWLILLAIGATFTSLGAGTLMQNRRGHGLHVAPVAPTCLEQGIRDLPE